MKLAIVLSTNNAETNWNAFRLANLALAKGDMVSVFLTGEGVEYEQSSSSQFNIQEQVETFLGSDKSKIIACGTCMKLRNQDDTEVCPMGGLEDLYSLVAEYDKVLTF
ncbi:MAG: sulfur reduction protein DsrE [Candidatus Levybacteria bacterium RIFCSPHIGHO2_01_FULL_36_15]|nr:MAG: sulfur reduction protein DsrE [Candidatus Levybacteria bacterium RIFCSPHIGHO2_01_FULL_36_15]OGH37428.1 MAG: sulfur reduction protein DsrE [Candidatus Levybacteria bacterium RIFCSPLOWO2_01_FULL_36_10]